MYYLHAVEDPAPLSNNDLKVTVERLKKEGKIRFFGFSCHNGNVHELLQIAAKTPSIDSIMFRYNFDQYGNKELNDAIDACAESRGTVRVEVGQRVRAGETVLVEYPPESGGSQ